MKRHGSASSPPAVGTIHSAVSENGVNGILLAACSERAKTEEFAALADGDTALFRAALREHCTWSHESGDEDTTMLAQDLVRMGLARLKGMKAWTRLDEEGEWALKGYFAASRIEGTAEAIDAVQTSYPHLTPWNLPFVLVMARISGRRQLEGGGG